MKTFDDLLPRSRLYLVEECGSDIIGNAGQTLRRQVEAKISDLQDDLAKCIGGSHDGAIIARISRLSSILSEILT